MPTSFIKPKPMAHMGTLNKERKERRRNEGRQAEGTTEGRKEGR
jgi:hypothetical protein